MKANRARWPVATMARRLQVSSSGYYSWLRREPSKRTSADAQLLARIRTLHASSRGTYGAPRIHAQLAREGVQVGRKRVARQIVTRDEQDDQVPNGHTAAPSRSFTIIVQARQDFQWCAILEAPAWPPLADIQTFVMTA